MYEIVVGRNPQDLKEFGTKNTGYIGKHIVGKGDEAHLTNKILLDFLRPHIILLTGKRGSGKCLRDRSKILVGNSEFRSVKKIFQELTPFKPNLNEIYVPVKTHLCIPSLSPDDRIVQKRITHLYRKRVKEKLVSIETETGRKVVVTKEHPLLTQNSWKQASKIRFDDEIRTIDDNTITTDKVERLKEISYNGFVYDFTIEGTHNFIGTDGIVCHNSYTGGVIAEEIALLPEELRKNLTVVMIDTMGIYWSMKIPNDQQVVLLDEWGLKPKNIKDRVKTYVPFEQKPEFEEAEMPVDFGISIAPYEFSGEDWSLAFNLPMTDPISLGLQKVVNRLHEANEKFEMDDLISKIKDDQTLDTHVKTALDNMLSVANQWGVFGEEGIKMEEIMKPGTINVFDVSHLRATEAWSVRNLLVAMIARKIYRQRLIARKQEELAKTGEIKLKERFPMVWLIMDECHQFIPADIKTVSTGPLLTIVKQGREPGISFVPMTQMPNKVHQEVISQSDMVISHRLTSKNDLDALHAVMQTYLMEDIWKSIDGLPRWRGSGIILDDNSERIYSVQIRPRFTWHAGESAIAVTE